MTVGLAFGQALTHGPVVGGVTDSKASVFVRTDQAANIRLRYGTDPSLNAYQLSETFQTSASDDFTKVIPLNGLSPEATFYINVIVNGVPQLTGPSYPSFATFPPSGSSRNFKFAVLTDFTNTKNLTHAVQTFATVAAQNPAFTFIGGDFDHRGPRTLADKRQMFKDLYDTSTPFMSDFVPLILRNTPIIHQWDDHDAGLNNLDKTYPDWNLSQQTFEEYVPSYPLPLVTPGIWQKFSYAQVDCFVLDCRSQRDPETDTDDFSKSMLDGNNLGATGELQWLKDGLLASTARWKIIFTSVIANPTTKVPDGWGGYQTEWNALRNFINRNGIQGVVLLSGDLHLGAIDNGVQAGFPEMCVVQPNGNGNCPTADYGTWSEGYFIGCTGYGLVRILTNPDRLILEVVDEFGNVQLSHTVSGDSPTATDLRVTVTDGKAAAAAGEKDTYTVVVANGGPRDVRGAIVADSFPANFTGVTFTATQSGGASGFSATGVGNINDTVTMAAGSSITYNATGKLSSSATGTLSNSASVTAPGGMSDSNPANNQATDSDTIKLQADLKVTVNDGKTAAIAGQSDTYTIVVSNAGPSDARGAAVNDSFPAEFTNVTFTATSTTGASGFAVSGSGNINDTVAMPSGSKITYKAKGTIPPSATGTISETATVSAPSAISDPNLANNSVTDTDSL